MEYRIKVTLADVSEEFTNLCLVDGYGCAQSIATKHVQSIAFPDSIVEARNYISRREDKTNAFIECFLQEYGQKA